MKLVGPGKATMGTVAEMKSLELDAPTFQLTVNGVAVPSAATVASCNHRGVKVDNACTCWSQADNPSDCSAPAGAASKGPTPRPPPTNALAIGMGVGLGLLVVALLIGLLIYRHRSRRPTVQGGRDNIATATAAGADYGATHAKLVAQGPELDQNGYGNVHYAIARGDMMYLNRLLSQPRSPPDHMVPASPGLLPLSPDSLPGISAPRNHVYEQIKENGHSASPYALPGSHESKRARAVSATPAAPTMGGGVNPDVTLDFAMDLPEVTLDFAVNGAVSGVNNHGRKPNLYSVDGIINGTELLVPARSPADLQQQTHNVRNLRDGGGNTPIAWAVRLGNLQALKSLLEWGADPNITNNQSQSPLHVACVVEPDLTIVRTLLVAGANPNAPDADGMTPFLYACSMGALALVQLLLEENIDMSASDSRHMGALHLSAARGHAQVLEMVLSSAVDVNAKDILGWTPLHWAAGSGYGPCVRALLHCKSIDPCLANRKGEIALHLAARDGNLEVVDVLLTQGRSSQRLLQLMAVTEEGFTARDFAQKNGQTPTVAL